MLKHLGSSDYYCPGCRAKFNFELSDTEKSQSKFQWVHWPSNISHRLLGFQFYVCWIVVQPSDTERTKMGFSWWCLARLQWSALVLREYIFPAFICKYKWCNLGIAFVLVLCHTFWSYFALKNFVWCTLGWFSFVFEEIWRCMWPQTVTLYI